MISRRSRQRDASRLQRSAVLSMATTTAHAVGKRSGSLDSALKRARVGESSRGRARENVLCFLARVGPRAPYSSRSSAP
jgi:hypothetical protein